MCEHHDLTTPLGAVADAHRARPVTPWAAGRCCAAPEASC